jgi:alkylation response protein AidB-like acyl-CoA dehydrogenase
VTERDPSEELRAELRVWLGAHFTAEVAGSLRDRGDAGAFDAHRAWNAALFDAGLAAVAWPAAHGGRAAGMSDQVAWHEEMARVGAPGPVNAIGVANIAPAIMTYGTPEQQERFLRPMLRGDQIWCQGMSEPDAGSDLASLRCAAVLDGDRYVVNGQKTWNSNGDRADWCQLYVRTDHDVPKHQGITCLLVDMRTPGIEARAIRTMAGDGGFSDLFFSDVCVPRSSLLGEEGDGWQVATRTLTNERAGVAALYLAQRAKLDRLLEAARPIRSSVARDALARRYTEVRILELLARRTLAAIGQGSPGPEGSVIKLAWSACDQALATTAVDLLGLGALGESWGTGLLSSRSLTIAGGTTEVNKNIIGERVLGLPREPSP